MTVGLQDVVFQNDQETEEILSFNTQLLFLAVLGSEKDLGEYKMNIHGICIMVGPMDTLEIDSILQR